MASFEYRLHAVGPTIIGGRIVHPFAAARDVLRFSRDFTVDAPDDLEVYCWLRHTLDSGERIAGMTVCHVGPSERHAATCGGRWSSGRLARSLSGPCTTPISTGCSIRRSPPDP